MKNYNSKLKIVGLVALAIAIVGIIAAFRFGNFGTNALWNFSNGGKWLAPLVAVSALLDSVNPCAISVLLLSIAFLFGLGAERSKIIQIGGFYILGIFIVYLLIGLGILQTLHLFNIPHFMAKVGASLLIVLGLLELINYFFPSFPIKLRIPHAAHHKMSELMERASLPAAFLLGGLVGICEFPCTGGPYLMILGLLHDRATFLKGLGYLIFYNLIFILPLVVILLLASERSLLEKARAWHQAEKSAMRFWGGAAMMGLGVMIFFL